MARPWCLAPHQVPPAGWNPQLAVTATAIPDLPVLKLLQQPSPILCDVLVAYSGCHYTHTSILAVTSNCHSATLAHWHTGTLAHEPAGVVPREPTGNQPKNPRPRCCNDKPTTDASNLSGCAVCGLSDSLLPLAVLRPTQLSQPHITCYT